MRVHTFGAFCALLIACQAGVGSAQTQVRLWGAWTNIPSQPYPEGLSNVVAVVADVDVTESITTDGSITYSRPPFLVALKASGDVLCWGSENWSQRTVPAEATNIVSIATGGGHSLAVRSDGRVFEWPSLGSGRPIPEDITNAIAVAAGQFFSIALQADGTVRSWGLPDYGLTQVPADLRDVQAIAAGWSHSLALKRDGTVVVWGGINGAGITYRESAIPPGLSQVVAIAAGAFHSLALRQDGTVVAWGRNTDGQTNVPAGLTNVVAVYGGRNHSLAWCADGQLVGWGRGTRGQTSLPSGMTNLPVVALAAGYDYNVLVTGVTPPWITVMPQQHSACVGETVRFSACPRNLALPIYQWFRDGEPISGATNANLELPGVRLEDAGIYGVVVTDVGAQSTNAEAVLTVSEAPPRTALRQTNLVSYLGANAEFGTFARGSLPLFYQWRRGAADIPGATNAALALHSLGFADSGNYSVIVRNVQGAVELSAHLDVGPVAAWGDDEVGQCAVPAEATNVIALAAGRAHSLALRRDGTVIAWGAPGPATVPAFATNIVAIAAGREHSLALTDQGTVMGGVITWMARSLYHPI